MNNNNVTTIPQLSSHQRCSSMILHDCTADFEESEESEPELTGDDDDDNNNNNNNNNNDNHDDNPNSPQKSNHHLDNASPTPNLEYRSYTPTYEEELLRYRKSSRGASIENLNKIDKDIEMEKSESENNRNFGGENTSCHKEDMDESTSTTKRMHETNIAITSTATNTDSSVCNNSISNNVALHEGKPPTNPVGSNIGDKTNKLPPIPPKNNEVTSNNTNNQKNESDETQSLLSHGTPPPPPTTTTTTTTTTTSDTQSGQRLLGRLRSRKQTIMAFLDSLNLDSRQNDGSPAEDIDANMEEFLRVPYRIEEIMAFGILICTDSFLHVLTVTPLKFIWSCLCLVCTIINPGKGIGWCRFHRRHLYQFVRVFVIYAVYRYCLSPISIGKMVSTES
jgi:hypothetical protein